MRLESGSHLGPYVVEALLGAGGMGEVYRARDTRLGRTVALKILLHTTDDFRQRFQREARSVASLNHPNICTLFDTGRHEDTDYLVMEHLEGQTLYDRLRKGPLGVDEAISIAIQIAAALATAHEAGVIHRDLKPGNVMLTRTGIKLLDFGLATHAAQPREPDDRKQAED